MHTVYCLLSHNLTSNRRFALSELASLILLIHSLESTLYCPLSSHLNASGLIMLKIPGAFTPQGSTFEFVYFALCIKCVKTLERRLHVVPNINCFLFIMRKLTTYIMLPFFSLTDRCCGMWCM